METAGRGATRLGLAVALVLLIAVAALAQRFGFRRWGEPEGPRPTFPSSAEFHFIRMEYTDLPQYHRGYGFASRSAAGSGWWMMDWPDADDHFTLGIGRLTRIDTGDPRHLRLTDEQLFEYPWIYATQTGWWGLTDAETARLREYLLRGGFLVADDFYGPEQWEVFRQTMERVLPGRPITDIPESDSVMHVLYDIADKDRVFIPGTRHLRWGMSGQAEVREPPGNTLAWRAMYDDRGRMIVAINFGMDVGDAWEYADAPEYPAQMTTLAYRFGINYIIYAMTH